MSLLPGKCENIHGHSMWVTLELRGEMDESGRMAGLDFGAVKKAFRGHLDSQYDHHLLLNEHDPFADLALPGLHTCAGDPTTENIARWIAEWAATRWLDVFGTRVLVNETHVNAAVYEI